MVAPPIKILIFYEHFENIWKGSIFFNTDSIKITSNGKIRGNNS
jgi:hypothetical protein